jgi:hypothetical protein
MREANEFEVADLAPRRLPRDGRNTRKLRETELIGEERNW